MQANIGGIAEQVAQDLKNRAKTQHTQRKTQEVNERLKKRAQSRRRLFAQNPRIGTTARTQRAIPRERTSQQGLLTAPNNMPSLLGDM